MNKQELGELLGEWLELWPAEVVWNGNKVRTDAKYCVNKMQKFVAENPQYTKQTIFAATKLYLQEQESKGWEYTQQAHFFIEKRGFPSKLEAYCAQVLAEASRPKSTLPPPVIDYTSDFI